MAVPKKAARPSKPTHSKKMKRLNSGAKKKGKILLQHRRGAVFISHLPYGFYEQALQKYFSHFGDIRRIRVARSLKNAKPMGYAYVEFEHEKVALIVAKTMNNYLMFKKLLKCKFIKQEDLKYKMFRHKDLTAELCPGTVNRRRNQYILQDLSSKSYTKNINKRVKKLQIYVQKTLGMSLDQEERTTVAQSSRDTEADKVAAPLKLPVATAEKLLNYDRRDKKSTSRKLKSVVLEPKVVTVKEVIKSSSKKLRLLSLDSETTTNKNAKTLTRKKQKQAAVESETIATVEIRKSTLKKRKLMAMESETVEAENVRKLTPKKQKSVSLESKTVSARYVNLANSGIPRTKLKKDMFPSLHPEQVDVKLKIQKLKSEKKPSESSLIKPDKPVGTIHAGKKIRVSKSPNKANSDQQKKKKAVERTVRTSTSFFSDNNSSAIKIQSSAQSAKTSKPKERQSLIESGKKKALGANKPSNKEVSTKLLSKTSKVNKLRQNIEQSSDLCESNIEPKGGHERRDKHVSPSVGEKQNGKIKMLKPAVHEAAKFSKKLKSLEPSIKENVPYIDSPKLKVPKRLGRKMKKIVNGNSDSHLSRELTTTTLLTSNWNKTARAKAVKNKKIEKASSGGNTRPNFTTLQKSVERSIKAKNSAKGKFNTPILS